MRTSLCLLTSALVLSSGCLFPFDRDADTLEGGTVVGRATKKSTAKPAPFALVQPVGGGFFLRAKSSGDFKVTDLTPGGWAFLLSEDTDGDGRAERTARRLVKLSLEPHATLLGQADPELTWVMLGDVKLTGPVSIEGTVRRGPLPSAGAQVFVFRSEDLADPADTDNEVDALLGAAAVVTADETGHFEIPDLEEGKVKVFALELDLSGFHTSDPIELDLDPSDAPEPLTLTVPDTIKGQVDIDIIIAGDPPDAVELRLVAPGAPMSQALLALQAQEVSGAGRAKLQVPAGLLFDLYVLDGDKVGYLSNQVAPPGGGTLAPIRLRKRGPCEPFPSADLRDDDVDCDHDGYPALPALVREGGELVGDIAIWAGCVAECVEAFGSGNQRQTCRVDGEDWDCDDDGDDQPDVTEPPECIGLGRGGDRDGDGLCNPKDGRIYCPVGIDPADCPAGFVPPGAWPEYEDEPEEDGGVPDAGDDAGVPGGDNVWTPGDDNLDFAADENWSLGRAPISGDTVIFDGDVSTGPCTLGASAQVGAVVFQGGYSGPFTLEDTLEVAGGYADPNGATIVDVEGRLLRIGTDASAGATATFGPGAELGALEVGAGIADFTFEGGAFFVKLSVEGNRAVTLTPADGAHIGQLQVGLDGDTSGGLISVVDAVNILTLQLGGDNAILGPPSTLRGPVGSPITLALDFLYAGAPINLAVENINLTVTNDAEFADGVTFDGVLQLLGASNLTLAGTDALTGAVVLTPGSSVVLSGPVSSPSASMTVDAGATLDTSGQTFEVSTLTVRGQVFGTGGGSIIAIAGSVDVQAGGSVTGLDGLTTGSLVVDGSMSNIGNLEVIDDATISGTLTGRPGDIFSFGALVLASTGSLSAPGLLMVSSVLDFDVAATFTHNNGEVQLVPAGGEILTVRAYGVSDVGVLMQPFFDFSIPSGAGQTVHFAVGEADSPPVPEVTVLGTFTALGAPGPLNRLTLAKVPAVLAPQWYIDARGPRIVDFLSVSDSYHQTFQVPIVPNDWDDVGNNVGWGAICGNGSIEPGEDCDVGGDVFAWCDPLECRDTRRDMPGVDAVWTGAAGDNVFTTGGNWAGGAAPFGAGTVAVFPAGFAGQVIIYDNFDVTIGGLVMESGFQGTLRFNSAPLMLAGILEQDGGTIEFVGTALSGTQSQILQRGGVFRTDSNLEIYRAAIFSAGTAFLPSGAPALDVYVDGDMVLAAQPGATFYDVNISPYATYGDGIVSVYGELNVNTFSLSSFGDGKGGGYVQVDGLLPGTPLRTTSMLSLFCDQGGGVAMQPNLVADVQGDLSFDGGLCGTIASDIVIVGDATYRIVGNAMTMQGNVIVQSGTLTLERALNLAGAASTFEMQGGTFEPGPANNVSISGDIVIDGGVWNAHSGNIIAQNFYQTGGAFYGWSGSVRAASEVIISGGVHRAPGYTNGVSAVLSGNDRIEIGPDATFDHNCGSVGPVSGSAAAFAFRAPGQTFWDLDLSGVANQDIVVTADEAPFTTLASLGATGEGFATWRSDTDGVPFYLDARGSIVVDDFALAKDAVNVGPGWVGGFAAVDNATRMSVVGTTCGDGITDPATEECDDGNQFSLDGCSPACTLELGWTCDDFTGCSQVNVSTTCGNGVIDHPLEQCEPGPDDDGRCNASCVITVGVGDPCAGCPSDCRL